jgi:hypothetical protein
MQMKLLGITKADLDVTDQKKISFYISGRFWRVEWEYNGTVHQRFVDFRKEY